jgi:hypothetical protein
MHHQDFTAITSFINVQGALLQKENLGHSPMEYSQGFKKFHEPDCVARYLLRSETQVYGNAQLVKLQTAVQQKLYKRWIVLYEPE